MKTEDQAWARLREHAASLIGPGLPDRVLRAGRVRQSPILVAHFAMCAATAALCLAAVALYHAGVSGEDDGRNMAGWTEISTQASDLEQGL